MAGEGRHGERGRGGERGIDWGVEEERTGRRLGRCKRSLAERRSRRKE
jgi:hypothetical protein